MQVVDLPICIPGTLCLMLGKLGVTLESFRLIKGENCLRLKRFCFTNDFIFKFGSDAEREKRNCFNENYFSALTP